jgi:hypothetical protein
MRLISSALIAALALSTPALAQDSAAKKPKATYNKKDTKTVKATVKSIDVATRHVVLTTPDGVDHSFVVGKQARNLPQVKVGDDVIVQYQEALAVEVHETDPTKPLPQPTEAIATERSDLGKKPEGAIARTVTLNGTVEAVDMEKKIAVIKGSGGNTVEVKMQHPERWENVKVGDTITANYSEALALSVQPAAPKPPKKGKTKAPAPAK